MTINLGEKAVSFTYSLENSQEIAKGMQDLVNLYLLNYFYYSIVFFLHYYYFDGMKLREIHLQLVVTNYDHHYGDVSVLILLLFYYYCLILILIL